LEDKKEDNRGQIEAEVMHRTYYDSKVVKYVEMKDKTVWTRSRGAMQMKGQ
jgi:hypothetical protein